VPIGPEHGIADLMRRVERGDQRHRFQISRLARGYGLAAAFGGAIVAAFFLLTETAIDSSAEFETLSTVTDSASTRIDVVFVSEPGEREIDELLNELDAVLISGPSSLGRYTFALESQSDSALKEIIAKLQAKPAVRFAGKSFMETPDQAGEDR
jgi:hypothetical protein